jgi:hypothetical protein
MCSNFCNYIFMNLTIINNYIKFKIKSYDSYFYNNNNNTSYNTNHKKNDSVIIDIPPEHITSNNNNNKIKITINDYKEPNSPLFPINEWDML